jgi:hypothetical protein
VAGFEFNILLASLNFPAVRRRRGGGVSASHAEFNALVPGGAMETGECACDFTFLASVAGFELYIFLTGLNVSAVRRGRGSGVSASHAPFNALVPSGAVKAG